MVGYSVGQIEASKKRFQLLDVCSASEVSDDQAVKFLDFYFALKSEFPANSVQEAATHGLQHGKAILDTETAFCRNLIEGDDAQE